MASSSERFDSFYPPDCQIWREWPAKNHDLERGIWLIYYKKNSAKPSVSYAEAVEEA